jgi:hypothetical protein
MTLSFVAYWKQKSGCEACIALAGKTMCAKCRGRALMAWHKYVAQRVTKGLCITCPRKPKPNEQRCSKCAERNRTLCKAWYHTVGKERVHTLVAKGICGSCRKRPAKEYYCDPCLARSRERAHGALVVKKPYKFLSMAA